MKNKLFLPLIIFILSLVALLDMFHPGLPLTHDGQDHVARIANFYLNLTEGNLIPRWAPNLNWGYGHPILMFLYPLPSYIASVIHFFGFSLVDSTKLVFVLAYICSALTMYLWLKEFLSREASLIGSLLYIFAPYRFVDLYVRGAIGEHVAFIFPPIILFSLFKLSKTQKSFWVLIGSFSGAGLILSHNAISLMFLPLIFLYIIYLLWNSKKKKYVILNSCLIILFSFALSSFFWLPALFEGKYTLRDIVTKGGFENNFGSLPQLFYGSWSYGISGQFTLQIGLLHWLAIFLSIPLCFFLYKKKNKIWTFSIGLLILFFISIFLIDKSSHIIWEKISLIQKFQFPWRFLSISVFTSSVLGALVFSYIPKKFITISMILLTCLIIFINKDYWHARGYLNKPESFYTSVYPGTTDTGESSPIWSVRFMEKVPKSHMEIISGKAKIVEKKRSGLSHEYTLSSSSKVQLKENTLYFPDWQVYIDGKPADIQFQDAHNRGLMTFYVDKGQHNIQIIFKETKLRLIADFISAGSLLIIFLYCIINLSLRKF